MKRAEPVLLRYDFEIGSTRTPATVFLGFPQRIEDGCWSCAFQFEGVGSRDDGPRDGYVHRVRGYSGLEALIEASNTIRADFEELVGVRSRVPYELVFPRFLPTSRWFHLYDWSKELVAWKIGQRDRIVSPTIMQLSRSSWDEQALLERQFKFVGGGRVTVRLAFPTFSQGVKRWTCAFQLRGIEGRQVKKVPGENGLLAVANAADVIRASLDRIGAAPARKDAYELVFPAHLPTEYGLKIHRQLDKRIGAEIKRIEQKDEDREHKRAMRFNEILAELAPSARL